jgi:hypothetical protein
VEVPAAGPMTSMHGALLFAAVQTPAVRWARRRPSRTRAALKEVSRTRHSEQKQ